MLSLINFYIFLTSSILCTILVPFVSRLSVKIGGVDSPDERKVHTTAIPRLGGIAIFASLLFTVIYFCDINQQMKGLLSGAIVIFLTGLADDLANLTPRQKFVGEFMAAGLAVLMGGIVVQHLGNPFGLGTIQLGFLAAPFTIIAIVGLINAINLLDGLDGLAGGVCAIASVSFAIISYKSGNQILFQVTIALLGALLGFLRYNNYPAKIFMGDGGSLMLGYLMGVFSVMLASGGTHPVSPYVPLIILGVPILDTLVVMANRKRFGKRLFQPDKTHLHHRLLNLGIGHRFTVLVVFGITYLLNLIAIFGCNLLNSTICNLNDTVLLLGLVVVAASVYGIMYLLTARGWCGTFDFSSELSLRKTVVYRKLVRFTVYLVSAIKIILIAVLLLPLLLSHYDISILSAVPFILLILATVVVFLTRYSWRYALLQCYIYLAGALMIFAVDNLGRDDQLLGVPLVYVSNGLFLLLFIFVGLKVFIRKRATHLVVYPVEYLIMLIVLSVPLLPVTYTGQYHLMSVAAKSVILFVSFKLVLIRQQNRNRKIIFAIALTSLVLAVRYMAGA